MTKAEIKKIADQLRQDLLNDEAFVTELAKEMLSTKLKDLGLQGPGSLFDFFRREWQGDARCNT